MPGSRKCRRRACGIFVFGVPVDKQAKPRITCGATILRQVNVMRVQCGFQHFSPPFFVKSKKGGEKARPSPLPFFCLQKREGCLQGGVGGFDWALCWQEKPFSQPHALSTHPPRHFVAPLVSGRGLYSRIEWRCSGAGGRPPRNGGTDARHPSDFAIAGSQGSAPLSRTTE